MAGYNFAARDRLRTCGVKLHAAALYAWSHRTKLVGVLTILAASVENSLAQYGHYLPDRWRGVLLAGAGVVTFLIGLYNSFGV